MSEKIESPFDATLGSEEEALSRLSKTDREKHIRFLEALVVAVKNRNRPAPEKPKRRL